MAKKKHLRMGTHRTYCRRRLDPMLEKLTIDVVNHRGNTTCISCLQAYIRHQFCNIQRAQYEITQARKQIEAEYEKGA